MSSPESKRLPSGENSLENRERPLRGKVVLITGSSRDIGAGIALALAEEGVAVIGNYHDKTGRAEKVKQEIEGGGGRIEFVQSDITVASDRKKLQTVLNGSFGGKLDILVLNTSGTAETAKQVCVEANNALVNELPMNEGGKIIFMQSVPGHFDPQLRDLGKMPDFYDPIAEAKYEGEQLLRSRIKKFEENGISFLVVCPPAVSDTTNIRMFDRESKRKYGVTATEKHAEISDMLGIPRAVAIGDVGQKVAELLKRKDLPNGYVELFGNVLDARSILSQWYGNNAIFVDTLEIVNERHGVGRLIVAKEYTKGHFKEKVGISVLPGHIMIEAAAQTLGLIALNGKIGDNSMPLFQGMGSVSFFKPAVPGEGLKINGEVTEPTKRGFVGNVNITNMKDERVAEITGLEAIVVSKGLARRLLSR